MKCARRKCAESRHAAFDVRSEKRVGLETACWVFYVVMLVWHAVRTGTVPGSWVWIFVRFGGVGVDLRMQMREFEVLSLVPTSPESKAELQEKVVNKSMVSSSCLPIRR